MGSLVIFPQIFSKHNDQFVDVCRVVVLTGGFAPTNGGVSGGVIEDSSLQSLLMSEKGRGLGRTNNAESGFSEDCELFL